MKRLLIIFFTLFLTSCNNKAQSVEELLESSKSIGDVKLVNDITQKIQTDEDEENTNLLDSQEIEINEASKETESELVSVINPAKNQATPVPTASADITIKEIIFGTGAEAQAGKTVVVHYIGRLVDGTKFDSSYDKGQPYPFLLGEGKVIPGFDLGIRGMRVGGKRIVTIPPNLAYGNSSPVPELIPNGSILIFEIELIDIN
jgi:FKBP-type peptidyl-prolyl cis-trans isomerase FkpA